MIISKKQIAKLFYDYTCLIYRECGKSLSALQKAKLKAKVEKQIKKYTFKNKIKEALAKCKKSK